LEIAKKKILFITTSSLAANPRLTKEIICLSKLFDCHVISYYHNDWTYPLTIDFQKTYSDVKFYTINRTKMSILRILSKMVHLLSIQLNSIFKNQPFIQSFASNDKNIELIFSLFFTLKNQNFYRIIAHNLGAFYPAYLYSERFKIPLQLDVEDYYPGEKTYFNHKNEINNRLNVMQTCINKAHTITYASKGIYLKCKEVFRFNDFTKHETIINSFPLTDFTNTPSKNSNRINCVWFSQHISHGRGIDILFKIAKELPNYHFHFIGNKNEAYLSQFDVSSNIFFYKAMEQKELHQFLCNMDVGLALEDELVDANRSICLTNKIITYAQAGLYIIATDTFGQRDFLSNLTYKAGEIVEDNLINSLKSIDFNDLKEKEYRKILAQSFSWEKECEKIKKLIIA